jgi:hypothetical protein
MEFLGCHSHQGHPASRMYSGSKPGAATLRVVVQSSRTVSFSYQAYRAHFRQVFSTFKHLTNQAIGPEPKSHALTTWAIHLINMVIP